MKLLFDQNISFRILNNLSENFEGSTHVKNEGLINEPDRVIWEFAKKKGYTIVTQDSDFNDLNSLYGFPPKIIWIRTGNLKTFDLIALINQFHSELENFIDNQDYGCFEILSLQ